MKDVVIDYMNHRRERADRVISPISIRWGSSSYHPADQWLLLAMDPAKGMREFAMRHISGWRPVDQESGVVIVRGWPNARDVARCGDMLPVGQTHLRLVLDNDNDVCVEIWEQARAEEFGQRACIEFCTVGLGGGSSQRTRAALIELMCAIEEDNAESPRKAYPPIER